LKSLPFSGRYKLSFGILILRCLVFIEVLQVSQKHINIVMTENENERQKIVDYVHTMLGGNMIDVELNPADYNIAIDRAVAKFRQRSSNAVEESFGFLTLQLDQNEYTLPSEVTSVRQIFRRSIGSRSGGGQGGTLFEPFNLAYSNTYLLTSTNMGGLATYYAFASYQKQVGKMFGGEINFTFNKTTKKLTIMQRPRSEEEVMMWLYNYRPDFNLMQDQFAGQWLKDYSLATSKLMLGEAREKFAQIASPQGGTSLNGTALKAEAKADLELLEQDLINYKDGSTPLTWVTG
jgi:hypothetical protein